MAPSSWRGTWRATWRWACVLALVLLGGCQKNAYELTLTPNGPQVERQLICWVEGGGEKTKFSEVEAERIAKHYAARFTPDKPNGVGFRGQFGENQPDDVGGSGTYSRFTTSLGDAYAYVERFRGDDDAAAQFERRSAAAADLARHAKAWAAREFKHEPDYAKLEQYLDREFARDALNLSLFFGPIGGSSVDRDVLQGGELTDQARNDLRDKRLADIVLRAGQYLVERNYMTPTQVPRFARAATTNRWNDMVADMIERKLGRSSDHPRGSLALLRDTTRLNASIEAYLRDTAEYQAIAERHRATHPNDDLPPPTEILQSIVGRLMDGSFVLASDQLNVYLKLSSPPDRTNGKWEPSRRHVHWNARSIDEKVPTMCYAFWSEPNVESQKTRFGKVALVGEPLLNYAIWYRGLTPDEASQWDAYLAKLEPGEQLTRQLQAFRFQDESESASAGRADALREILLPLIGPKP